MLRDYSIQTEEPEICLKDDSLDLLTTSGRGLFCSAKEKQVNQGVQYEQMLPLKIRTASTIYQFAI